MMLFPADPGHNLLPFDGIANYYGPVVTVTEARRYLDVFLNTVPWRHDEAVIYGKRIQTARKVAWYGDSEFSYTYSGTTKVALPWNRELQELKEIVERITNVEFNSCLCNLYHSGAEGMSWHSDDEKALGKNTTIASLTLGAERTFRFRHKNREIDGPISVLLETGSLLVMKGATQTFWQHCVPKTTKCANPRINLTFRTIVLHNEQRIPRRISSPLFAGIGDGSVSKKTEDKLEYHA